MDRVIPKDVLDLIYKESHLDKTKRLNAEYYERFHAVVNFWGDVVVRHKFNYFNFCYRKSVFNEFIYAFRNNTVVRVGNLPPKYFYSSGHSTLKWIE